MVRKDPKGVLGGEVMGHGGPKEDLGDPGMGYDGF